MKKKELKDLRTKEAKDLRKILSERQKELLAKNVELTSGKEKNLKASRNLRREIAQVLTVIKEQEIVAKITKTKE